jgi:hypothetical protein
MASTAAQTLEDLDLPSAKDGIWAAVNVLFQRLWFSRMWIVQEAVLAAEPTIACGDKTTSWEVLCEAVLMRVWKELDDVVDPKTPYMAEKTLQGPVLQLGVLRGGKARGGQTICLLCCNYCTPGRSQTLVMASPRSSA